MFEEKDEGVNINAIVQEAGYLLSQLDEQQSKKLRYNVTAKEWRAWSNPEILLRPFGLRIEEGLCCHTSLNLNIFAHTHIVSKDIRDAIHKVIEASLSPEGYQKALAAMRINHFLGECVKLPQIMNQDSYNFLLFGNPSSSPSSPWGWLLYGHHLDIACFLRGSQIVISPTFTGAEPNIIDAGPWKGTQILHKEGNVGLALMQSLTSEQQNTAQIYKNLHDDAMPQTGDLTTDRWNKDDQRHLCGAFRDNRVVPYEGVLVSSFTSEQQSRVLEIAEEMLLYLPSKSRSLRLEQIKDNFQETYFSWIGGYGDDDAFYFRIQSPVVILEFDHHSGVFLNNAEPKKFHTHTIVRTPNAGDYGQAIRGKEHKL